MSNSILTTASRLCYLSLRPSSRQHLLRIPGPSQIFRMVGDFRGKWKLVENENVVEFRTAMGRSQKFFFKVVFGFDLFTVEYAYDSLWVESTYTSVHMLHLAASYCQHCGSYSKPASIILYIYIHRKP